MPSAVLERPKVTPADVAKKIIKRSAKIRTVKLGEMRISPTAQRDFVPGKGRNILDNLNLEDLGTFTLSFRDGLYWVVDGQHRLWALKEFFGDGWEDWEVEAWTYFDLSESEEAEKFLVFNDSLAVNALEKFMVGVEAKRHTECEINRIVLSLGLKVSRSKDDNSIQAVASLKNVYLRNGTKALVKTLVITRESFAGRGFEAQVIEGIAKFVSRFEGRFDDERLIKRLNGTVGGYKGVQQRAYLIRENSGAPTAECVAAAITDIYNKGLRGVASLGSWWKDGRAVAA